MHLLSVSCFWILALAIVKANDGSLGEEDLKNEVYKTPLLKGDVYFLETFDDPLTFERVWFRSEATKNLSDGTVSKYDGIWNVEAASKDALPGDLGLVLKTKDKLAAISAQLKRPFVFYEDPFILQYEVLFQEGQGCGGAYLKLLSEGIENDLTKFHEKTPYTIMFGPDKCGSNHNLHFIFRHKNPINGNFEEKHCKKPKERIDDNFTDRKPHLYTLVVNPDNTFQIYIDQKLVNNGSLLDDFSPAVNPPAEIDDPQDFRPSDWDDREKVVFASAVKPDDWDESAPEKIPDYSVKMPVGWLENEPTYIPDPLAEKPSDWDNSMDGEWEAPLVPNPACDDAPGCGKWEPPMIRNPEYKGKWTPPLIDNPNYQGKWEPRRIPNPDYFEDKHPFRMTSIYAVGFEIWTTSHGILFDNIIITDKHALAEELADQTYNLKKKLLEIDAESTWGRIVKSMNYKSGWWSLYFLYCSLPVGAYVWYLWRRVREDTFVNRFIAYTNTHPWLWAVYVVVLLIPITLTVIFCFGSSSKEKEKNESDALRKKTDEPELDDDPINVDGPIDVDDPIYLDDEPPNIDDNVDSADSIDLVNDNEDKVSKLNPEVVEGCDDNPNASQNEEVEKDYMMPNSLHEPSPRKRCQRID